MTAGYSGTPLLKKLGLKPGMRAAVLAAPDGYERTLGKLPPGLNLGTRMPSEADFIHFFADSRRELTRQLPMLIKALKPDGMLWISWPKKASKVPTDITEDVLREVALPKGLVDVKVCAVDDTWSGLKLVRRLENR